ncbi:hypothetical protein [Ruminococcus sp.]|uniref:hypothetical protein n=1 Tax=Ruminococcus sp. TaxID=41978 RepID=UPI003AF74F7C
MNEYKYKFLKRYDKDSIEPFAINTIAQSFNERYAQYYSPKNTDNFDFISPDKQSALEVTLILPENERKEYEYEKALDKNGKANLHEIKGVKTDENNRILSYYGGSISEIKKAIVDSINRKNRKALKRLMNKKYSQVDLCLVIQDGALLDFNSFKYYFEEFYTLDFLFRNIFFITRDTFIRYSKSDDFVEYKRKIKNK